MMPPTVSNVPVLALPMNKLYAASTVAVVIVVLIVVFPTTL